MLICRQGTCERVAKERGYTIIPPYDHNDVIGGQVILVDLWLKKKQDISFLNSAQSYFLI